MGGAVFPPCYLKVESLSPTLWDPVGCSPSGSSVHGILKARVLKWFAIPFSSALHFARLSTITRPSWVALHRMAHSFTELDKVVVHLIRLVSFL